MVQKFEARLIKRSLFVSHLSSSFLCCLIEMSVEGITSDMYL